jgi:hypothetical protein
LFLFADQGENFAQEVVIALADIVLPGGIGTVTNWAGIYNQYTAVRNALGANLLPGGTCGPRKPDA